MSEMHLLGVGIVAPGLPNWEEARLVLTGIRPYQVTPIRPLSPAVLPPNERRRATLGTRIALEAARQANAGLDLDPRELVGVFTASESDLGIIDRLCTDIFQQHAPVSPTVFHNSVHNAVGGYWSIAHGCQQASTSISAWDGSLAAGLMECAVQIGSVGRAMLLVAYDLPGPPLLDPHRHLEGPCACALVLAPTARDRGSHHRPLAALEVSLAARGLEDRLAENLGSALETLRAGNPAARVLPLLCRLAAAETGSVRLPYLDDMDLLVEVH